MNDAAPNVPKVKTTRAKPRRGVFLTLDNDAVLAACAEQVRRMFPGHLVMVTVPKDRLPPIVAQIIMPRERKPKAAA